MANDREWQRRSDEWVAAQNRSKKKKEEADKLNKHGEERRRYIAERELPVMESDRRQLPEETRYA